MIFVGPWEVIRKLGLEEELLKLTELRRTEEPGNSRGRTLGLVTLIHSSSAFLPVPQEWLPRRGWFLHSGYKRSVTFIPAVSKFLNHTRPTQEIYWLCIARTFRPFFSERYLPPTASTAQKDSGLMCGTRALSLFSSKMVQAPLVMCLSALTD